jgi:hypothetical protein
MDPREQGRLVEDNDWEAAETFRRLFERHLLPQALGVALCSGDGFVGLALT